MTTNTPTIETIGGFVLAVAIAEPSPQAEARWAQRPEVLANWLLGEWKRAHEQCRVRRSLASDTTEEGT